MTQAAFKQAVPDFNAFEAFEALPQSVLITDSDLGPAGPKIIYANPAFEWLTGWSLPEIAGKSPRTLNGPETDAAAAAAMRAAMLEGISWEGKNIHQRKDGTEFTVEWAIAPLRDSNGRITSFIAVLRNLTKRLKVEQDLGAALAARHESDQTKIDFLAIMNHELRTPLNVIMGFSEIVHKKLIQTGAGGQITEYVGLIHDSGKKLLAMVTDILDFARGSQLREGRVFMRLDLGDVIRRCLDIVESKAKAKSVCIVAGDLSGMSMCAYEPSLRKIFINILDNAIEFTPPGGRVTIVRATQGDEMHIVIADQGPGIPQDYLDKLFSPFAQADAALTRSHEGLGLGLAIAQRLAHLHGGRIEIESAADRGTCAHVFLPRGEIGASCDSSE